MCKKIVSLWDSEKVMSRFMISNRPNAWKSDVSLFALQMDLFPLNAVSFICIHVCPISIHVCRITVFIGVYVILDLGYFKTVLHALNTTMFNENDNRVP